MNKRKKDKKNYRKKRKWKVQKILQISNFQTSKKLYLIKTLIAKMESKSSMRKQLLKIKSKNCLLKKFEKILPVESCQGKSIEELNQIPRKQKHKKNQIYLSQNSSLVFIQTYQRIKWSVSAQSLKIVIKMKK